MYTPHRHTSYALRTIRMHFFFLGGRENDRAYGFFSYGTIVFLAKKIHFISNNLTLEGITGKWHRSHHIGPKISYSHVTTAQS